MTRTGNMVPPRTRPAVPPRPRTEASPRNKTDEAKKTNTVSRRLGGGVILFLLLAVGAVLFGMLFGVFDAMFRLETVTVEGTPETAAVLDAAALTQGDRLYTINRNEVRAAVLRANPYLADVRLERHLPDTVTLVCTPREGAYYMEINGDWVILTQELVVLECGCTPADCEERGLVQLILPEVRRAVTGEYMEFAGDFDPGYLTEILAEHRTSPLYGRTDLVRIDSRFDVRMILDSCYAVTMGDCTDTALKLTLVEKILSDGTFNGKTGAFVDISNPAEGSAILDKMTDYTVLWRD